MESMEKSEKPFIDSTCFITGQKNGKIKTKVKNWTYENGKGLRFVTTEDWVVSCNEIEIEMESEILNSELMCAMAKSYTDAQQNKALVPTESNVETNNYHEQGMGISPCSKLDPFTLRESTDNKIQIGDIAILQSEDESRECIVRWTGLDNGIWKVLIEYITEREMDWQEGEGIFDQQRLWHPDNGKFCDLVSMNRLERTSPPRSLNAEITTKQLLCRHLGCKARIPIRDDNLHGRVLWTGYINKVECVLVETTSFLSDNRLPQLFSINPAADIYPAFLLLNDTKSLYLVSSSKVVICDEECQLKDSVQVQNPPSPQSHAQHSQQGMTTVWGQPTTKTHENPDMNIKTRQISFQDRRYELCSSPKLDALGDTILVKLFSGQYKGILCWIGTQGDEWFVGVEIDKNKGVQQHGSTNGMFDGQRLWFQFRPDFLCFLLPLQNVDLSIVSKLWCSPSNLFTSPPAKLSETSFLLGEHVKFNQRDDIACVVWTGRYERQDWAVIKLAMDTANTDKWRNRCDPKKLVKCETLPGFYAKMLFVPIDKLTHLNSQLHIPMIEDVVNDHINTQETVQCKNGSLVTGLVKWCGRIDGSILQYGIQMKLQPPDEYRPIVPVLSYLASFLKSIDPNTFWIVPLTKVIQKYEVRTLHATDYPYLRLVEIGKAVKVELSPSVTLNGNVSWCGYVENKLMVAVQTNEPIPIEYNYYPGLAKQLELQTRYTLFVPPEWVRETTRYSPQSPPNNTRKEQRSPPKTRKLEIFNGITYEREFFEQLKPLNSSEAGLEFKENYLIEVELDPPKGKRPGICRYMGMYNNGDYFIGVELLQKTFEGGTDGTFPDERGVQLFKSSAKCGIIVALERIRPVNLTIPLAPNSPFADCKSQKCVKVWCDVPHSYEFFTSLRVAEKRPEKMTYEMNFLVEVNINEGYYKPSGACKWLGVDHTGTKYYVGVALDEPFVCEGTTDGEFCGLRVFSCKSHCGVILPSNRVKIHRDVARDMFNTMAQKEKLPENLRVTELSSEDMIDDNRELEPSEYCDEEYVKYFHGTKGIQGNKNSCYMDTTLLAMFALNNSFDSIFTKENCSESKAMKLLRQAIVRKLRKDNLVPYANIMSFRGSFEAEGNTQGMTSHQKDPEEFLITLFEKIAKTPPFLQYKDGHSSHLLQLFFFIGQTKDFLTTGDMLKLTFEAIEPRVKLSCLPENLIMQIPRDGRDFHGCRTVKHDIFLDMASFIDKEARAPCIACEKEPSSRSCPDCSSPYCEKCVKENGVKECKKCGSVQELDHPYELELYAVLCIEISHFVAFLRVPGEVPNTKPIWLFYDSMHDRRGDVNIPIIEEMDPGMEEWVKNFKGVCSIYGKNGYYNRLATNPYVLFYRDPRRSMYKVDHFNPNLTDQS